tara:strand:+ start:804 stop:1538 length:735 start_codon:yes stop_codon:yes gene_type:complete
MSLECPICERQFQVRSDYNAHYNRCKLNNESAYKAIQEGYSVYDNARTINNLIEEVERLKNIITKIQKNYKPPKIKNINVLEYLNENIARRTNYKEWEANIEITYKKLKLLLSEGFREGVIKILKEELDGDVPLISFCKKKVIYIYENDKWIEYTNKRLEMTLYTMLANIIDCWNDHEKLICGCDYEDIDFKKRKNEASTIYLKNRHILYGDGKVDEHAEKIYDRLYTFLKTNINSIIVTDNYI